MVTDYWSGISLELFVQYLNHELGAEKAKEFLKQGYLKDKLNNIRNEDFYNSIINYLTIQT